MVDNKYAERSSILFMCTGIMLPTSHVHVNFGNNILIHEKQCCHTYGDPTRQGRRLWKRSIMEQQVMAHNFKSSTNSTLDQYSNS
eukprot:9469236-Pyramimonas_sp.AAC.3